MIRKDGFKYSFDESKCEACGGKCCTGESGYIFVNVAEMETIAKYLNVNIDEFAEKYARKIGSKFSLIEKPHKSGKACIFFNEDNNKCNIYDVRPNSCRTFPFWDIFKNNPECAQRECMGVCIDEDKS